MKEGGDDGALAPRPGGGGEGSCDPPAGSVSWHLGPGGKVSHFGIGSRNETLTPSLHQNPDLGIIPSQHTVRSVIGKLSDAHGTVGEWAGLRWIRLGVWRTH